MPINGCRAQMEEASKPPKQSSNAMSSLLFSHGSSSSEDAGSSQGKKKYTFCGFGCRAAATKKVSDPAAVRSSSDYNGKRNTINILKPKRNFPNGETVGLSDHGESSNSRNYLLPQDVWCGPVMGFSAEDVVFTPVEKECVVTRRIIPGGRGRCDIEKVNSRERGKEREREIRRERVSEREKERPLVYARRSAINPNSVSLWETRWNEHDFLNSHYHRHVRHPSRDELAEVVNGLMMLDRFSDWRLDIDEMSYEQLLELGDKIGHVSTGLKEEEIIQCIRKVKSSSQKGKVVMKDKMCIICQEDFECDNEEGKMSCGHGFHYDCLKEWLGHKKCCPVCKCEPHTHI